MKYKFPLLGLCGKAPIRYLNPFLFILNGVIVAHNSCVFTASMSVYKSLSSSTSSSYFTCFVEWRFLWSWFRFPKDVAILGGRCFNNCWLLRPVHIRKFLFVTAFSKVLWVGLNQNPWRYWLSSVFVLSRQCLNGLEMGMSHNPYVFFLCTFIISVLSLRILISF